MTTEKFYEKWRKSFFFEEGKSHLFIVRGLPGSGKSSFCSMLRKEFGILIIEPDSFVTRAGNYEYSKEKFEDAVFRCNWIIYNHIEVMDICYCDVLPKKSDVFKFTLFLQKYPNVRIVVIDMPKITKEMSKARNVHGVSDKDLTRMANTWEDWDE